MTICDGILHTEVVQIISSLSTRRKEYNRKNVQIPEDLFIALMKLQQYLDLGYNQAMAESLIREFNRYDI